MAVGSGAAGKAIVAVLIKSGKAHHIIAHRTNRHSFYKKC